MKATSDVRMVDEWYQFIVRATLEVPVTLS
jgi:hypothetical protein